MKLESSHVKHPMNDQMLLLTFTNKNWRLSASISTALVCVVCYNHFVESWKSRCSLAKGRDLIKLMVTWGQCGLWLAPVSALWLVAASYQLEEVFQKSKSVKWLCCEIFIFSFFLLHQDELVFKWRRIFRRDEFFSVENIASFSTAHSHLYAVLENASVYHCTKIELTYILYFINILHGEYFV